MSKASKLLDFFESQGLGTGREMDGGSDYCVCPNCGYQEPHDRGVPCNQKKCPKCGTPMVGSKQVESLEISTSNAKAIGALLKNSSYLGVRVIDSKKGLYSVKIAIANNEILEIFTKKEGNKVVYDKTQLDETGIKAFIEWFNDKLKDVLEGGK